MINHWGCNDEYSKASYQLSIPKEAYKHDFLRKLLSINKKHVMHKLISEEEGEEAIESYMNDLNTYEKKNVIALRFTSINQKTYQFKYKTVYKVYLYDENGSLKQKTVDLLGPLLRKFNNPEDSKTEMGYCGPVWLWSSGFDSNQLNFYLEIQSDIYFPYVNKKFKISQEQYPDQQWIDNTELATLNSKIFNEWFKELIELFRENDGTVKIGEQPGINEENKVQLTKDGIILLI